MQSDKIWLKSMNVMSPTCHQREDRSYHIGKYQFPVCARCQGVYIGYLVGLLFTNPLLISLIPLTYIEGYIQLKTKYNSSNPRRLITGLLSGIGTTVLIKNLITMLIT